MNDDDKNPSLMIKASVNVHGELHLDKVRTNILIHWLESCEKHNQALLRDFESLIKLLEPVLTSGLSTNDIDHVIKHVLESQGNKKEGNNEGS
ncbi:unnamed protein product [Sphagnum jensenii]|uniref:Uncharacterized protein n=1 Tax=Sphagnum jensenii TaxID=128206 RepID=A0ABP0V9P3_9BRYO